jgi:hypothetical protein
MSARRSHRIVRRRYLASEAKVRSTTQRYRPKRSLRSIPFRAMRHLMPRCPRNRRQRGMSHPLSACSFSGRLRRLPRGS